MAKEPKPPTVKERLAVVEGIVARDNRDLMVADRDEDKLIQEGEDGDIRQALDRAEIRRLFLRVMKMGGLMQADSDPNATVMAHHVGSRWLALQVFEALSRVDPGWYWKALREEKSNAKSKENQNAA